MAWAGASPIYRNQELAVVGGGDTATEEAVYLTKYGKHVRSPRAPAPSSSRGAHEDMREEGNFEAGEGWRAEKRKEKGEEQGSRRRRRGDSREKEKGG